MRAIFAKKSAGADFRQVPAWPGHFDIKIDWVAAVL
jgi:hypothetical protein